MRFDTEEQYAKFMQGRTTSRVQPPSAAKVIQPPAPEGVNAPQGKFRALPAGTKESDYPQRGKVPNKTEASYATLLGFEFPGCKITFESISLRLENGHRYTPDLCVHTADGLLLVEVKNAAYKHASYGRSKMAFAQCRIDYPQFRYRWTEKDKNTWDTRNF
jgi:hypothetical protein